MKRKYKKLMLSVCLSVLATVGMAHAENGRIARIINGNPTAEGEFPFMVALVRSGLTPVQGHFCGGTLIAPQYVLTAAHCVVDYFGSPLRPRDVEAILGTTKLSDGLDRGSIKSIYLHPSYSLSSLDNDVAILKLAEPAPYPTVRLAQPSDIDLYEAGQTATILGWGAMDPEYPVLPDNLQSAQLPIASDLSCSQELGRYFQPESMMCAGTRTIDGSDVCYGDSGGPLLAEKDGEWIQLGITSWGFECASTRFHTAYSEVSAFYDWITSDHISPPVMFIAPQVIGEAKVGKTVSCEGDEWSGDEITGRAYSWFRNDTEIIFLDVPAIAGETQSTYVLKADDIGKFIYCMVVASNEAGEDFNYSSNTFGPVLPEVAAATPTATATATPTRTSTATPTRTATATPTKIAATPTPLADKVAPSLKVVKQSCNKRVCTVLVESIDSAGGALAIASGVKSVEAKVNYPKMRSNLFWSPVMKTANGLYRISFSTMIKGKYTVDLQATDNAGNVNVMLKAVTIKAKR